MSRVTYDHLVRLIRRRISATPDGVAMRYQAGTEWREITYGRLGAHIDAVASWLIDAGVRRGERVAIFAPNTPWWTIADLATLAAGAVTVPIYPTNTALQAEHIVRDAGVKIAFVGGAEQYAHLAGVRRDAGPIERVVSFDAGIALDLTDSCPMSVPLAHPVSPDLVTRGGAASRRGAWAVASR